MPLGSFRLNGLGKRLPPSGPVQELFTLWSWGQNGKGQLGSGNTTSTSSPNQVGSVATWTDLVSGQDHSLALRSNGTLWSWGNNRDGATGLGTTSETNTLSPTQIGSATTWAKIAAGGRGSAALTSNGELWCWGDNPNGQVGNGNTTNQGSPVQIGSDTNWKELNCGRNHKLAIKTNGTLWAWGQNSSSQLGDGTSTQRTSPVQIGSVTTWKMAVGGQNHSLALRTNGTLWSWGANNDGVTGLGNTNPSPTSSPTQIGTATDWAFVAAGNTFSFAIKTNGTLWAWGRNGSGQLGRGNTTTPQTTPVQIGSLTNWKLVSASGVGAHAHGVTEDGKLYSWGDNGGNGLGDGTSTQRTSPVQIGTATDWGLASAGLDFGTALRKA